MSEGWRPALDEDSLIAGIDLLGRTGAVDIEFGHLEDEDSDLPIDKLRWYAKARWGGRIQTSEEQPGPVEAVETLARRMLDGGMCAHCQRRVALAGDDSERCRWTRQGKHWVRGCEAERPASDEVPTKRKLATALQRRGAPPEMVENALLGLYDDYESPVPEGNIQLLVEHARFAGLDDIAEMAINGEFDGTKAESDAWAASPEGREVFGELEAEMGPDAVAKIFNRVQQEAKDADQQRTRFDPRVPTNRAERRRAERQARKRK